MYKIGNASNDEREILFRNTSAKMGINTAVIEKDFWVCLCLDYLFHKCRWKNAFAFKGGTSLSKAYNLIERFSEDIDIVLDWRVLHYSRNEPWEERSNTMQEKFIADSRERLFTFLQEVLVPEVKRDLSLLLRRDINVFVSDDDAGTINFEYPGLFLDDSILRVIRLEIGALAAWTPIQTVHIKSYAAECYPKVFEQPETEIPTTTAARTFWEKATILHHEAFRPEGSKIPERYSRHYYDLFCMANKQVKEEAMAQPDLLGQVADFKQKFYHRGWARYDLARVGTLKLSPPAHSEDRLRADYARMKGMIYGEYPSFEEIMKLIKELEEEINNGKYITGNI